VHYTVVREPYEGSEVNGKPTAWEVYVKLTAAMELPDGTEQLVEAVVPCGIVRISQPEERLGEEVAERTLDYVCQWCESKGLKFRPGVLHVA